MEFLFINVNHTKGSASSETIPLSMGYVLAYLRRLGHGGVILDDLLDRRLPLYALDTWIAKLKPAMIGFTAYQDNMERIRFFSHYVKLHYRHIQILLGGPQATFLPSAALRELEDIDIICRGEGEKVTAAIAECVENGDPLSSVKCITFREDDRIIDTPPSPELSEDLDQFPSPYLSNIINLEGRDTAMIFTSRGCRYNCPFCISPSAHGRKLRHHSAKRVLDEMRYLSERGVRGIWFADPNFPVSYERDLEILQGKMRSGIKMPFWCKTRWDLVDERILRKLREAGADAISLDLDPANLGEPSSTGKDIAPDRIRGLVEFATSIDVKVELTSIFGLPGETFEKAHEKLDFLRTCMVPFLAQQMQLYFGSTYEKDYEKYGFNPIPGYRPSYLSIGHRYETPSLTRIDIRKLRTICYLAGENVRQGVQNKEEWFNLVDYLLNNEEDLRAEEQFFEYGAVVSSALEEEELLWRFLDGYVTRMNPDQSRLSDLLSKLRIYEETNLAASAASRVVMDCRSEVDDVLFRAINTGYQDIVLGQGVFPASCETHFVGVREGKEVSFEFILPKDYFEPNLRDKTVKMWARIHKVLNPVRVTSLGELRGMSIQNHYRLRDLDRLSREDDVLYHFALKTVPEDHLVKMPTHFLRHLYHYGRLHRVADIKRLAGLLASDREALEAVADVLHSAGRYSEATYYYDQATPNRSSTLIKKARSLFSGGLADKALELLNSMPQSDSLSFQELLLQCLKEVQPHSERIPRLDRHVLDLKVEAAMDSEIIDGYTPTQPIVHGLGR